MDTRPIKPKKLKTKTDNYLPKIPKHEIVNLNLTVCNLPSHEEIFVQSVMNIQSDIIVSSNIYNGTWKHPVNCYNL